MNMYFSGMCTYIIIFINIIIFFMTNSGRLDSDDLSLSYHQVFNRKQYYRLITSSFVHGDILHLACNMFSLYNVGTYIEFLFGPFMYLVIYFGSMIFGHIGALLIRHNDHNDYMESIGASGAISGIIGAYFMLVMYSYGLGGFSQLLRPLASILIISFLPGVDGSSHFCCMAVGMAITCLNIFF